MTVSFVDDIRSLTTRSFLRFLEVVFSFTLIFITKILQLLLKNGILKNFDMRQNVP